MTRPHYLGMNALQSEFLSSNFQVLGFPCNNFNLQEPGSNYSEILNGIKWVRPGGGFMPNFQMFKKIDVNGKDEHPLYTYLKSMCGPTNDEFEDLLFYDPKRVSDVRWNFEIFLINRKGYPLYRYSPDHPIPDIEADIRQIVGPVQPIVESNEVPLPSYQNPETEISQEELEELTNNIHF